MLAMSPRRAARRKPPGECAHPAAYAARLAMMSGPAVQAEKGRPAEQQQCRERTEHLVPADLRGALAPVDEEDRRLADPGSCLAAPVEHFLLEGISARAESLGSGLT